MCSFNENDENTPMPASEAKDGVFRRHVEPLGELLLFHVPQRIRVHTKRLSRVRRKDAYRLCEAEAGLMKAKVFRRVKHAKNGTYRP